MSVVVNFPAIPNRIAIACEYLQASGGRGVPRSEFERVLTPARAAVDDEDAQPGKSIPASILDELLAFSLATLDGEGVVRLASELAGPQLGFTAWRDMLVPRLRQALVDPDLASASGQRGVPDALAWLLCQDPARPIRWSGAYSQLIAQQVRDDAAASFRLGNDSRFQNLVYWARYVGLAETFGFKDRAMHVIPDPTRAIRDELPLIFTTNRELPVMVFVERLAQRLPVLETGSVRNLVEAALIGDVVRGQDEFSTATALALTRLSLTGELALRSLSDAPRVWLLKTGAERKQVTNLIYSGATP